MPLWDLVAFAAALVYGHRHVYLDHKLDLHDHGLAGHGDHACGLPGAFDSLSGR